MKIKGFFAIILTLILNGCKKNEATIPVPYDLIIEGGIYTNSKRQYIRLSKPISRYEKNLPTVKNAIVIINDGENDIYFKETEKPGIYSGIVENNKNFFEPYTLTVEYDNKRYTAVDTLTPVYPIDLNYIPASAMMVDNQVRLNVPKHNFGTLWSQQWLILPEGELMAEEHLSKNYPFSYSHSYGTPNALHPLTQKGRVLNLAPNSLVNIYKFSLSAEYSAYLYRLFQETDWKGILSAAPGNIKGNISGNANGFFYTTDVEMQTRSVNSLIGK
ncbi:hypothetical protein EV200_102294 [Pedobacter psychrotolerans]|uniref:DUF4249 domain-containing protein n=1 Tax=Pedobacter psychrotolerans TaxID=1843235 RepID=A0A4R2HIP5_9SPHI|nr:hypothetical protein [Pedobacter psychrotolerans]TCO28877.1 hypothetical protein EV200_102294 [Pedobacter psychrotolerans]GGE52534.1 hypothetical protein GCM10011413_18500 [Pedobacter psychrotolerans]